MRDGAPARAASTAAFSAGMLCDVSDGPHWRDARLSAPAFAATPSRSALPPQTPMV